MKRRIWATLGIFVACFSILQGSGVYSQSTLDSPSGADRSGLEITPAIFEQVLTPQKSVKRTLQVTNITSDYLLIHTKAQAFIPYQETINKSDLARFNAADWIKIADPDFILKPGAKREIKLTLTAPQNAEPGGHYATILLQPMLPQRKATNTLSATNIPNIAALAFLTVPGDIQEKLRFEGSVKTSIVSFSNLVTLPVTLQNTGNIHIIPRTTIKIRNWYGKIIKQMEIEPRIVLPNTRRDFSSEWGKGLRLGLYTVQAETHYGTPDRVIATRQKPIIALLNLPLFLLMSLFICIVLFTRKSRGRWQHAWHVLLNKESQYLRLSEQAGQKQKRFWHKLHRKWQNLWKSRPKS